MKTHELFIEDAPEQFKVRAWDDQGLKTDLFIFRIVFILIFMQAMSFQV